VVLRTEVGVVTAGLVVVVVTAGGGLEKAPPPPTCWAELEVSQARVPEA